MLLEAFRNHKRWLMLIAMVFVIPSFVVTGIYSYNRMMTDDNAIAKIDDESITPNDFDNAKRKQLNELQSRMGESFRSSMLDTQEARVVLLKQIMNERSLRNETVQEHASVPEAAAVQLIKSFSGFQKDGKFSSDLYAQHLARLGYNDAYFVHLVQGDIERQLLLKGISDTSVAPQSVVSRLNDLLTEKRTVALHSIAADKYLKQTAVSEKQAREYWAANETLFTVPDEIDVDFVTLTPEQFVGNKPTQEDVTKFYEQNQARFAQHEQRRASHILIDFSKGKEEAKKAADDVFAQVRKTPQDFAKLAKKYSTDPGSARDGGDLGFFGKGMMVPEFEKAVFEAKKGDVVGPVETAFGYHIILVSEVKPASVQPLSEVRDQIVKLYDEQESLKRFATESEQFSNMTYEQSDSLAPVVEKYGLKIQSVKNLTAAGPKDPAMAKLLNFHMMESLFADEAIKEKRNTVPVEVAANTLVSARVTKYVPSHVRSFEQCRAEIEVTLKAQQALALAQKDGEKLLAQLQSKDAKDTKFAAGTELSRSQPGQHDQLLVNEAMRVPAASLPAYVGVALKDSYVIARVSDSVLTKPDTALLEAARKEISKIFGVAEESSYLAALRAKHGAQILNAEYAPAAPVTKKP